MGLLQQITDIDGRQYKDVAVPQWENAVIRLRMLTSKERDEFDLSLVTPTKDGGDVKKDGIANHKARLVAMCAYDPATGEKLFATEEDAGARSPLAMDLLYAEARELTWKPKAELEKN